MERRSREKGYVCKLCGKTCLSSKVLGGHMRAHAFVKCERNTTDMGFDDGGGNAGYGLRINPKKSWKFSGKVKEQVSLCKVCGKVFESKKALFGHMGYHSVDQRKGAQCCKDCGQVFGSLKGLSVHMRVHKKRQEVSLEETLAMVQRRKRSSRIRYKNDSPGSCSFSSLNESKCGNGYGKLDVEEAAMCLIMISRDLGNWGHVGSVISEFSDGNSLSFEVMSSGRKGRVRDNGVGDEDAGYVQIKRAKVEMLANPVLDCVNASNVEKVSEFAETDSGFTHGEELLGGEISEEVELGVSVLGSMKFDLKACDSVKVVCATAEAETFVDSEKRGEYECRKCQRSFATYQALGGHQSGHRRAHKCPLLKIKDSEDGSRMSRIGKIEDNCKPSKLESVDNSRDQEKGTMAGSERKGHECHTCLKVFASGQALGGHMRVHFVKDSELGADETTVLKQQISGICDAFKLNHTVEVQEEHKFKPGGLEMSKSMVCW